LKYKCVGSCQTPRFIYRGPATADKFMGLPQLKILHVLAISPGVLYQFDIQRAIFKLEGIGLFDMTGIKVRLSLHAEAQERAYLLESEHQFSDEIERVVARVVVHESYSER
jgi:hypothetical protein